MNLINEVESINSKVLNYINFDLVDKLNEFKCDDYTWPDSPCSDCSNGCSGRCGHGCSNHCSSGCDSACRSGCDGTDSYSYSEPWPYR